MFAIRSSTNKRISVPVDPTGRIEYSLMVKPCSSAWARIRLLNKSLPVKYNREQWNWSQGINLNQNKIMFWMFLTSLRFANQFSKVFTLKITSCTLQFAKSNFVFRSSYLRYQYLVLYKKLIEITHQALKALLEIWSKSVL